MSHAVSGALDAPQHRPRLRTTDRHAPRSVAEVPDPTDGDRAVLPAEVAAGLAGAGLGLAFGGPPGMVLLGAAAPPLVQFALLRGRARVRRRKAAREKEVLLAAATAAGITVLDLLARMKASPAGEELLLLTLRAASETGNVNKLFALAQNLGSAARASGSPLAFETMFARALGDCDSAHVYLLETFTKTGNELSAHAAGHRYDPAFDQVPVEINQLQIETGRPELREYLDPLLAVLQRHGLVVSRAPTGGMSFSGGSGGPAFVLWKLTPFGRTFLDRLHDIAPLTRPGDRIPH